VDMGNWQLRVPDDSQYWLEMVKCQYACPVNTDACAYVTAIAEGRYEDAYRAARATNPFASICGRVCGAPCEANCRRGSLDEPVAIRALKRFVTDKFGPETGDYTRYKEGCDQRMLPPNRGDYERVAVIGAGVSGLTVAHDLVQVGYKVTVFEADSKPGGMLMTGVPVFRLPRELVNHEIQAILSMGVDLKCNMKLGRDFTIQELRDQGYKAVFLGVGLPNGRKLSLPGGELVTIAFQPNELGGGKVREDILLFRSRDGGYHHASTDAPSGSAYALYLAIEAYADAESLPPEPERIPAALETLRATEGGYANEPGSRQGQTNATAAACLARLRLGMPTEAAYADFLLTRRDPVSGGFFAYPGARARQVSPLQRHAWARAAAD